VDNSTQNCAHYDACKTGEGISRISELTAFNDSTSSLMSVTNDAEQIYNMWHTTGGWPLSMLGH